MENKAMIISSDAIDETIEARAELKAKLSGKNQCGALKYKD